MRIESKDVVFFLVTLATFSAASTCSSALVLKRFFSYRPSPHFLLLVFPIFILFLLSFVLFLFLN